MKRLFYLFATVAVSLCTMVACSENEEPESPITPPGPEPSEFANFDLEIKQVTKESVSFAVNPHDATMTYVALIAEKSYFEEFGSDDLVVDDDLAWFQELADRQAMNLDAYLRTILKKGELQDTEVGLSPDTEYYLYAYGLTEHGEVLTVMDKLAFRTEGLVMTDTTFTIELSDISFNSAKVKITPSDESTLYFVNVFSEEHYQYYGGDEEAFQNHLISLRDYYLGKGASIEQMIANLSMAGEHELTFDELQPDTKYYAYAIGIDRDFFANTKAEVKEFKTLAAEASDLSFEFELSSISYEGMQGTITPSNNTDSYLCSIQVAEALNWYEDESDFINVILEDLEYWYGGVEASLRQGPSELNFVGLTPDTEYVVVCFGWDKAPTTDLTLFKFTTEPADENPEEFSATFEITDITHKSASATIHPSNGTHYFLDWCDVESFNAKMRELGSSHAAAAYFIEEEIAYGAEWFGGSRIEYLVEMGSLLGTVLYPVTQLTPNTEYLLMVMPIDLTTGEIASSNASISEPFRTLDKILSDAAVSFEFGKVYDGSALAELDPTNFLQCTGYAVMPYKVMVSESAERWYTHFYPYDMSEWLMDDEGIYDELITYGYELDPEGVSLNRTEGVAVMEWDTVFTFLGIAQDGAGNFGPGAMATCSAQRDKVAPAEEFLASLDTTPTLLRANTQGVHKRQPRGWDKQH